MTPYVFMILIWLTLFYGLLYKAKKISDEGLQRRKKIFIWISGFTLFFIMGFRHYLVGIDTPHYLSRYYASPYQKWEMFRRWDIWIPKELGFTLVGKILYSLHASDKMYLLLYGLFISVCISRFIYKWCKNPFWGFYLHTTIGLFTMSMSGMRQSIACCICWLGIDYILEKKPIRFILLVLLAATFHQSAIFFLAFYFARYVTIKKVSGWMISCFSVAFVLLRPVLIPLLSYVMPAKYEIYGLVSDKHQVNPLLVVIALLIPMFCLFFWERCETTDKKKDQFYSLCFAGSFCYALIQVLSISSNMIGRMNQYFYIFNVVLLGNVISEIKDYKTRYIASVFALILPGYMFFKAQSLGISPYYFFWQIYGE
ncbi:MAG: EpsG family protein [Clostridia bacterium]|nr:EpsG family protein [Clostridia bacterium]